MHHVHDIGGVLEVYRREGARLNLTARVGGFSSHVIGSRNLDMGLASATLSDGRLAVGAGRGDGVLRLWPP